VLVEVSHKTSITPPSVTRKRPASGERGVGLSRNLGVRSLIVAGIVAHKCTEIAVRGAATAATRRSSHPSCIIPSAASTQSLLVIRGYCRRTIPELLAAISTLTWLH
jgi:nicotinamidase-related amidase